MVARKASKAWKHKSKSKVAKRRRAERTESVIPDAGVGAEEKTEPANSALQVETFSPKQVDIDEFFSMQKKKAIKTTSVEAEEPKSPTMLLAPA